MPLFSPQTLPAPLTCQGGHGSVQRLVGLAALLILGSDISGEIPSAARGGAGEGQHQQGDPLGCEGGCR